MPKVWTWDGKASLTLESRSRLRELWHRYIAHQLCHPIKYKHIKNLTPFRLTHNEQPNQAMDTEPTQSIYWQEILLLMWYNPEGFLTMSRIWCQQKESHCLFCWNENIYFTSFWWRTHHKEKVLNHEVLDYESVQLSETWSSCN